VNPRYTLVLFLIFVAFVAFAITQRDAEPTQLGEGAPTATPAALLELIGADVEEVDVDGDAASYVLTRVSGGWEVDGSAASDQVDGVVTRLADLAVTRELPADRDPETYGFATPSLTVTLGMAAGDKFVILVGDELPGGYDRYVKLAAGEGAGADVTVDRIVIVSGGDFNSLLDWLTEPPLAPTATPEPTATSDAAEADAEADDAAAEETDDGTADESNDDDADADANADADDGDNDSTTDDAGDGNGGEAAPGADDGADDGGAGAGGQNAGQEQNG